MSARKWHVIVIISAVLLVLLGALLGIAIFKQTTDKETLPISTSIAVPKPATPREVKELLINSDGDLIVTYNDGSVQNAGRLPSRDAVSQSPTAVQIYAALLEYCSDGRCDAKAPTQAQIITALGVYCAGGVCKGDRGQDATPLTAEQIATAVAAYCSDGRCKGDRGAAGANGTNGRDPVISCVERSGERYVAWKYADEPDTSYRNLYRLPLTATCESAVVVEAA